MAAPNAAEIMPTAEPVVGNRAHAAGTGTAATASCCVCACDIEPNAANMCVKCIRSRVDITDGISKQLCLSFCKSCERYAVPPTSWIVAPLESRELLTICLKKIKGLSKVKLIDADFIWTEPHSRRIKVKVTVQKEIFNGAILEHAFPVEYVVQTCMCPDCQRMETDNTWKAVVQVRQKVEHKKTFFYLEQLILKYDAHGNCSQVKEVPDGVDFYFLSKSNAMKFIEFLQNVVPLKYNFSEKLISHDDKSNTFNFNYSMLVELAPICRYDLICLPRPLMRQMGMATPVVLVTRVTNLIHMVDPMTLKRFRLNSLQYYKRPFLAAQQAPRLTSFVVLDMEVLERGVGRDVLVEVEVARESDFGVNDTTYFCRSHLGSVIRVGDVVLGYNLSALNMNEEWSAILRKFNLPDIMLVRKAISKKRKGVRKWKLKKLQADNTGVLKKAEAKKRAAEFEEFIDDIETDPVMRQEMNLYRADAAIASALPDKDTIDVVASTPAVPTTGEQLEAVMGAASDSENEWDDEMAIDMLETAVKLDELQADETGKDVVVPGANLRPDEEDLALAAGEDTVVV